MTADLIPEDIRDKWLVEDWRHAAAILSQDFPQEWGAIVQVLRGFTLRPSDITTPGGRLSSVSQYFNDSFVMRGWREKSFDTSVLVDETRTETPTHKVDCFKNEIALEVEWNNKDPFFDRDLNNFRLLFELRAVSVGVILTKTKDCIELYKELGRGKSTGESTTVWHKLLPRMRGGGAAGCPVLAFGMTRALFIGEADE